MPNALDQIVDVTITQQTQAVQQQSFSVPAIFGPTAAFEPVATTATTVSASKDIVVTSATGIAKGQGISGTGIPTNTTVASVVGTTVTMSKAATASGSGVAVEFVDLIRAYTTLSGMVADGFETSDPEYIRATELLEQALQPDVFYVGHYDDAVEQVDTFQVNTLNTSHLYTLKVNGTACNYQATGGDAEQDVLNGLLDAIGVAFPSDPPVTGAVTSTGPSALLTLTSSQAGAGVTYSNIDSFLTHVELTENHTIVDDIIDAQSSPTGDLWYGLSVCSQDASDLKQVAAYIETQVKIFGADSNAADILTSSTTDIASYLKGKSYKRTWILYSAESNNGAAAAWIGGQLPQTPGASTWKFKQLVGITPDTLTASQRLACIGQLGVPGKNCNIYETVGGVPITEEGVMVGGQFIDLTVGLDWLRSTMQANVYSLLVQNPKVPYTVQGEVLIENAIRQTLQQGVTNGLIDGNSPITVTVPEISSISVNDRAIRLLPDVTFSCRLAGALHFVVINGSVSV
jgi:hypothetical protein